MLVPVPIPSHFCGNPAICEACIRNIFTFVVTTCFTLFHMFSHCFTLLHIVSQDRQHSTVLTDHHFCCHVTSASHPIWSQRETTQFYDSTCLKSSGACPGWFLGRTIGLEMMDAWETFQLAILEGKLIIHSSGLAIFMGIPYNNDQH